jgi:hypothetical protein
MEAKISRFPLLSSRFGGKGNHDARFQCVLFSADRAISVPSGELHFSRQELESRIFTHALMPRITPKFHQGMDARLERLVQPAETVV